MTKRKAAAKFLGVGWEKTRGGGPCPPGILPVKIFFEIMLSYRMFH